MSAGWTLRASSIMEWDGGPGGGMRLEVDWHDNGALIWTWPLALLVGAAGVGLLGVAVFLRDGTVSIFGGILLFVAGSGRVCSALELRYADVALAQPSGVVHHSGVRRRSLRRSSGVPWVTVALGGLVVAAVAFGGGAGDASRLLEFSPEVPPLQGAFAASIIAFFSFLGFEAALGLVGRVTERNPEDVTQRVASRRRAQTARGRSARPNCLAWCRSAASPSTRPSPPCGPRTCSAAPRSTPVRVRAPRCGRLPRRAARLRLGRNG